MPEYHDREYALTFLLGNLAKRPKYYANYYQALELMGDQRAISILREHYEEYRQKLIPFEEHGIWSELPAYQCCCRALWKLTGSDDYRICLEELRKHPDEHVRMRTEMLLKE